MNNTVALNSLVKDQLNQRDEIEFRNLPNNIEAEQGLLGAILINNDAYDKVSSFLREEHFFEALHGRIYDTASQLIAMGKNASPVTLKTHFENDPVIQEIGGTKYLARLAADATSVINAKDYGQTIYDLAVRRGLINVGEDIVNNAYEADVNSQPQQQIEIAEQELYKLAETDKYGGGFQSFSTALTEVVIMAEAAYKRDGNLSGISTGLHDLDKMMGGLQKSDLIILAGRPSMGKTALATNIAFNAADLQEPASQLKLDVQQQTDISRNGSVVKAGDVPVFLSDSRILKALFSDDVLNEGLNTEVIEVNATQSIVLRVKDVFEPRQKPLDEVRQFVNEQVIAAKTQQIMHDLTQHIKDSVSAGLSFTAAVEQEGYSATNHILSWQTTDENGEVLKAVFAASRKNLSANVRSVFSAQENIIFQLTAVNRADDKVIEDATQLFEQQAKKGFMQRDVNAYFKSLESLAEVQRF